MHPYMQSHTGDPRDLALCDLAAAYFAPTHHYAICVHNTGIDHNQFVLSKGTCLFPNIYLKVVSLK